MSVWVIAENAVLAAELVSGAKEIGKGAEITAFVGGDEAGAKKVAGCGVAKAYSLPLPAGAMWEAYTPVLVDMAKAAAPRLILVGATRRGRDMAAQLAAYLDAPCVSDCKLLEIDGNKTTAGRMIYGGMATKTMSSEAATVIAILGAKTFEPATGGEGTAEVLSPAASKIKVNARQPKNKETVNLADAAHVVGVGRGFAEKSDLVFAEDLAKAMGAEIACSRPIAEFFKWLPEECYLGISGQVIKPQVYVAAGVSGQAQHTYGVRDAKVIVGVNKDENAPMLQLSDYFIVGDIKEVLPVLTAAFNNK